MNCELNETRRRRDEQDEMTRRRRDEQDEMTRRRRDEQDEMTRRAQMDVEMHQLVDNIFRVNGD